MDHGDLVLLLFKYASRLLMIPMTVLIAAISGGFIGAIPDFLRAYLGTAMRSSYRDELLALYGGNALIRKLPSFLDEKQGLNH